jgi:alpha,alpha-trehalase
MTTTFENQERMDPPLESIAPDGVDFSENAAHFPEDVPALRPPYPAEPIDPLSIVPKPGAMGELYVKMRGAYPDGMSLACASPRRPYGEIVDEYARRRNDPGFSHEQFWRDNFDEPSPDDGLIIPPRGMDITSYIQAIRPLFIRHDRNTFDIPLPYPRSVAGFGRFGEQSFLWDGYHMLKGFAADGEWQPVLNTTDNTENQINVFGHALNGSADFYASRSQPPYFSHEVSMLADKYGDEALVRYLPALEKEYQGYWMDGREELERLPDDGKVHGHRSLIRVPQGGGKFAYLNRYWDDADGPRLESFKEDVDLAKLATRGLGKAAAQRREQKLYKDVRGAAASGWDISSRWLEDGQNLETINTTDVLPVDLNSLLSRYEQVLAEAHLAAGNPEQAMHYAGLAKQRVEAIDKYLWDPKDQLYRDYNFRKGRQTDIVSAATAYPLYVGIANEEQAYGVASAIEHQLLLPGGVAATAKETAQQWDYPNVWAPPNWAVARGLARTVFQLEDAGKNAEPLLDLSEQVRESYRHGVETAYKAQGTIPEKHRGDNPAEPAGGGEYNLVRVLAMSGEIYRAFSEWQPRDREGCLPIGHYAVRQLVSTNP